MPKTIYAYTRGSYSDYRVEALFTTEEAAKKFIEDVEKQAKLDDTYLDEPEVAELMLYAEGEQPRRVAYWVGQIWANKKPKTLEDESWNQRIWEVAEWDFEGSSKYHDLKRPITETLTSGLFRVTAKTQAAVAKILNERKASYLAGSWDPFREEQKDA